MGEKLTRRVFLGSSGAALLATACDSIPLIRRRDSKPERAERSNPGFGDIVTINEEAFLLSSNGKRYPFANQEEFAKYQQASRLHEYQRRVFATSNNAVAAFPIGKRENDAFLVSPSTGFPMANQMGEIVMPWAGLFTSDQLTSVTPEGTFPAIFNKLQQQDWPNPRATQYMYDVGPRNRAQIGEYSALDTLRPIAELLKGAGEHKKALHDLLPYCQENDIGHSLGGVLAINAVMEHPDFSNCLVLIDAPVRGVKKDIWRGFIYDKFPWDWLISISDNKDYNLGIDRKQIEGVRTLFGDLFSLAEDKEYQKKLDDFSTSFVASGKKLIVVMDKSDPIVYHDDAKLKGAKEIIIESPGVRKLPEMVFQLASMLPNIYNPANIVVLKGILEELLRGHGNPLSDKRVLDEIGQELGQSLSFPIGVFNPRTPTIRPALR